MKIDPPVTAIGKSTPVKVHVTDPHGARHIGAFVEQNGARYTVFDKVYPAHRAGSDQRGPAR